MNEDKKKNIIPIVLIGILALGAILVVLNNFIFSTSGDTELSLQSILDKVNFGGAEKEEYRQRKLDSSIINDPKFTSLEKYEIDLPDINRLIIGKNNPFIADDKR